MSAFATFRQQQEKTTEVPDLTLTKGGTVSIRLVDAKTREPIKVPPEAQALIGNQRATDLRPPANSANGFSKQERFVRTVVARRKA